MNPIRRLNDWFSRNPADFVFWLTAVFVIFLLLGCIGMNVLVWKGVINP